MSLRPAICDKARKKQLGRFSCSFSVPKTETYILIAQHKIGGFEVLAEKILGTELLKLVMQIARVGNKTKRCDTFFSCAPLKHKSKAFSKLVRDQQD